MKHLLYLLVAAWTTCSVNAQNTIAKIKYEQAEEAYNKADYATTLTQLEETEKLLGTTNPKILYLRILAQNH